jgi:hypothetical protein
MRLRFLFLIPLIFLSGCDTGSSNQQAQFIYSCRQACNKSADNQKLCKFYCGCALDELKKEVSDSGQMLSWYFAKFNYPAFKSKQDDEIMKRVIQTCSVKTREFLNNDKPAK